MSRLLGILRNTISRVTLTPDKSKKEATDPYPPGHHESVVLPGCTTANSTEYNPSNISPGDVHVVGGSGSHFGVAGESGGNSVPTLLQFDDDHSAPPRIRGQGILGNVTLPSPVKPAGSSNINGSKRNGSDSNPTSVGPSPTMSPTTTMSPLLSNNQGEQVDHQGDINAGLSHVVLTQMGSAATGANAEGVNAANGGGVGGEDCWNANDEVSALPLSKETNNTQQPQTPGKMLQMHKNSVSTTISAFSGGSGPVDGDFSAAGLNAGGTPPEEDLVCATVPDDGNFDMNDQQNGEYANNYAGSTVSTNQHERKRIPVTCRHWLSGRCNVLACRFLHDMDGVVDGDAARVQVAEQAAALQRQKQDFAQGTYNHRTCRHWMQGRCNVADCRFAHSMQPDDDNYNTTSQRGNDKYANASADRDIGYYGGKGGDRSGYNSQGGAGYSGGGYNHNGSSSYNNGRNQNGDEQQAGGRGYNSGYNNASGPNPGDTAGYNNQYGANRSGVGYGDGNGSSAAGQQNQYGTTSTGYGNAGPQQRGAANGNNYDHNLHVGGRTTASAGYNSSNHQQPSQTTFKSEVNVCRHFLNGRCNVPNCRFPHVLPKDMAAYERALKENREYVTSSFDNRTGGGDLNNQQSLGTMQAAGAAGTSRQHGFSASPQRGANGSNAVVMATSPGAPGLVVNSSSTYNNGAGTNVTSISGGMGMGTGAAVLANGNHDYNASSTTTSSAAKANAMNGSPYPTTMAAGGSYATTMGQNGVVPAVAGAAAPGYHMTSTDGYQTTTTALTLTGTPGIAGTNPYALPYTPATGLQHHTAVDDTEAAMQQAGYDMTAYSTSWEGSASANVDAAGYGEYATTQAYYVG
eukprot:g6045.t1